MHRVNGDFTPCFFSILRPNNDESEGSRKFRVIKIEFLIRARSLPSHHLSAWGASTWTPGSWDPPRTPSAAVCVWRSGCLSIITIPGQVGLSPGRTGPTLRRFSKGSFGVVGFCVFQTLLGLRGFLGPARVIWISVKSLRIPKHFWGGVVMSSCVSQKRGSVWISVSFFEFLVFKTIKGYQRSLFRFGAFGSRTLIFEQKSFLGGPLGSFKFHLNFLGSHLAVLRLSFFNGVIWMC